MKARTLRDLLKKGDRVAVSNITGREASKVSAVSQSYCGNVVAGWALGKDGQRIAVAGEKVIPVYGQFGDMIKSMPAAKRPNKIIVYSPPEAVYGDVKEVLEHGKGVVETIFVITEHVSIEVTAKLKRLCESSGVDIVGCNTLGIINAHDGVRAGAVGGDSPAESFTPGSAAIISNSGNMVNTIASYLRSAGIGVSYGVSTGKDPLILTPVKDFLALAHADRRTSLVVLYVEPGGVYEKEAIDYLRSRKKVKPVVVYVAGSILEKKNVALGHAGAIVEGGNTSAEAKMRLFDEYFQAAPYRKGHQSESRSALARERKGIRVSTLHEIPAAAGVVLSALEIPRDFKPKRPLTLNPWIVDLGELGQKLPRDLVLHKGVVPQPYRTLVEKTAVSALGGIVSRQAMRNASHASSSDGAVPRIYGYSLLKQMEKGSFAESVLLYWLGSPPTRSFEARLFEMCLIASLTNGPGTISAQAAKLSASAGNEPNTAMMSTLGSMGLVHGGNGKKAARLLVDVFRSTGMKDPYDRESAPDLDALARDFVIEFKKTKAAAKEAGLDYERIPCLGHPVFNTEQVNYDPRERVISEYLGEHKLYNVFLDFYHRLSREMMKQSATTKVHAVNVDAAITCVCMGIAWPLLVEKKITLERAMDMPFVTFALGRAAGGTGEYLDHRDSGTGMDMRVPVRECRFLGREKD
ncbi:MAG: citrate/2-methylcitrate synthase [Kiritimatiellia bacterium]